LKDGKNDQYEERIGRAAYPLSALKDIPQLAGKCQVIGYGDKMGRGLVASAYAKHSIRGDGTIEGQ
jgi:hypothetical protein